MVPLSNLGCIKEFGVSLSVIGEHFRTKIHDEEKCIIAMIVRKWCFLCPNLKQLFLVSWVL